MSCDCSNPLYKVAMRKRTAKGITMLLKLCSTYLSFHLCIFPNYWWNLQSLLCPLHHVKH